MITAISEAFSWLEEQQKKWAQEPLGQALAEALAGAAAARKRMSQASFDPAETLKELEELHQLCWKRLHSEGHLEATSPWREVFALCCFMRTELRGECSEDKKRALRLLDLGLILGGPDTQIASALHHRAEKLAEELSTRKRAHHEGGEDGGWLAPGVVAPRPAAAVPEVASPLSLEDFLVSYFATKSPVKIAQGCQAWPAVRRWREEAFWSTGALGQRFVPVETDYWMEEGFDIMQLKDFIQHCKVPSKSSNPSRGGYLAQHALFDQLPCLEADLRMPDLALCGDGDSTVLRQVFFGPEGTMTPLHSDPYENIFCQVVGVKYLRLYAPSESRHLYPREDMKNNSRLEPVDVLLADAVTYQEKFPEFLQAEFQDVVLHPGDVLYLPVGWWHFVKSFSTSISVAFHFT